MKQLLLSLSLLPHLLAFQSPHLPSSSSQSPDLNSLSNSNAHNKATTPPPPSTSSTTTRKHPSIVFPDFEFTPNGICTNPRHFVDSKSHQWFTLRNVPGEGDCMFLAVAVAASFPPQFTASSSSRSGTTNTPNNQQHQHQHNNQTPIVTGRRLSEDAEADFHGDFPALSNDAIQLVEDDPSYWRTLARNVREQVAQVLESSQDTLLYIGRNRPLVRPRDLLRSATRQEGLSSTLQYLESLRTLGRHGGLYGGGPELTVMSNLLQRPIAIYEVSTPDGITTITSSSILRDGICPIVCRGIFGDGRFDTPPPLMHAGDKDNDIHDHQHHHHSNDALVDNWKLHVLVVDASPQEKHACVLMPMPKKQIKLP